jgi:hypothetical protein
VPHISHKTCLLRVRGAGSNACMRGCVIELSNSRESKYSRTSLSRREKLVYVFYDILKESRHHHHHRRRQELIAGAWYGIVVVP